jgi:hypothetical protein
MFGDFLRLKRPVAVLTAVNSYANQFVGFGSLISKAIGICDASVSRVA